MPSIVQELSGHRDLGGLRLLLDCPFKATVLREGPAQDSGPGAAWLAYLCPVHTVDLDGWPGTADHADNGTMPCGTVLDFRSGEERLQSHADLWLTRLSGARGTGPDLPLSPVTMTCQRPADMILPGPVWPSAAS